jgi:nucleoporin NUP2
MSKRRADFQLDRDGRHKAIEEELDRKAEEGKFSANQLSSANTAGRKIAKLRKPLNKPEPAAPAAAPVPAVNVFANLMKHSNKFSSVLLPEPSEEVDKMTKFKAINFNFSQKVSDSIKEDPQCDLSKACEKYLEYAKEALTSSSTPESKETPPVKETPFKNFKPQLSKPAAPVSNSFEQLKKLKPASEKPSITELPTSDEESEKPEIKGPQFTLSNKPVAKKPAFVFGAALAKKQAAEKDSDESDVEEPKGPTFTFGGQVKDPVFKLEKKEEKVTTEVEPKPAEKPKFTFNLGDNKKEESTPAATEGASTFKFDLNTNKPEEKQPASTLFNFGAKDDQPKSVPTFNFGKPAESKPASTFSFGKPADSDANPIPTFSFNKPKDETKPAAFSFGKPQQSENTTAFGTAKTFSFDKKEESNEAQGSLPTSNFKFSLPFNQTKAEEQPKEDQAPVDGDEEKQEPLKLDENEEQTENLLYSQKAQLKVYQPENKESPYTTKGVGMFKILQSKEDSKKYRFLLRTEGMGNIILNTYIISAMTYEQIPQRKKTIKMPIFNNETKKLETYLLTVKTEEDANEIIKVIENAQANMK